MKMNEPSGPTNATTPAEVHEQLDEMARASCTTQ
jgi:hypothetical protein